MYIYRKPISDAISKVPHMFDRVQAIRIGSLEADLESIAITGNYDNKKGDITFEQIQAAAKIEVQSKDYGSRELLRQLDRLCLQYDTIREAMPSSDDRTRSMTKIVTKMRALAPATAEMIETYKRSGSPGSRLAAIAMMQMEPSHADLNWLKERFWVETPFVFYHAALALRNSTIGANQIKKEEIGQIARAAMEKVQQFEHGTPDSETLEVLSTIT